MSNKVTKKLITFTCGLESCGKVSYQWKSKYEINKFHYCSRECYNKSPSRGRKADAKNKITFTCERRECTNTKTMYNSVYDSYKHHFCSKECRRDGIYRAVKRVRKTKEEKALWKENFLDRWNDIKWEAKDK